MKQIKVAFRQKGERPEVAERQINDAFDILFAEVMKRLQKKKYDKSINNNVSVRGGDYKWAS